MSLLAPLLQSFFTDRLIGQHQASGHTIICYKTTFRLLLGFATARTGKQPSALDIDDIDADLVAAFLDHLETGRHNSVRTRNNRLAAIHSMFGYAVFRHPEHAETIRRVLAIPTKRYEANLVSYLTVDEVDALLTACDQTTWTGRRDHAMLTLTAQTGLRISELTGLAVGDIVLGAGPNVHCRGKGRKERRTPLTPTTVAVIRGWLAERGGELTDPLFATSTGRRLSRDAVEHRLAKHVQAAATGCPAIQTKTVTMHTLRHTASMRLLENGVDITIIALWLGHSDPRSTTPYLHADMTHKRAAIERVAPPHTAPGRYRPTDTLLAFLEGL